MMIWLKVFTVGILSAIGVCLLDYVLTVYAEPVRCDAGNENPDAWIDAAFEKALSG
jgi:hypothetical protein